MQKLGTEAIRTQIKPSRPKQEITDITNSPNTKSAYDQSSKQQFPIRWPLSNRNRTRNNMKQHKVKRHKNTGVKLDGKSIWKIHMDFFFENPFFLNLF